MNTVQRLPAFCIACRSPRRSYAAIAPLTPTDEVVADGNWELVIMIGHGHGLMSHGPWGTKTKEWTVASGITGEIRP